MNQPSRPSDLVRKVLHTAALFLCIFLFIRTFAVEPFGVPTGSMADTFLGNHREADCPRCGHPVRVGDPGHGIDRAPPYSEACCPNCNQRHIDLTRTREVPGDRLLVDKNVFGLRSPRRWEIAVFRCPVDDTKPYVKRVIGLPGETVQLLGGDVFADGVLQRKTLAQVRETAIPFFDLNHAPPGGWKQRILVPIADDLRGLTDPSAGLLVPADADVLPGDGSLMLDANGIARRSVGLVYRHWNLDEQSEDAIRDQLGYNGPPRRSRAVPVHDFYFACDIDVIVGGGAFDARLHDGGSGVLVQVPVGGNGPAKLSVSSGASPTMAAGKLAVGRTHRFEFALVDRRATVAIDGTEIFPPLDLDGSPEAVVGREAVSRPLQIAVRGAVVRLRNVRLFRDVHYRSEGQNATHKPLKLPADEYFMLGDNSGNSLDSRDWAIPGVPERDFIGKPFLIHQPLKVGTYTVNGETRTYQTVDWDRVKWLR